MVRKSKRVYGHFKATINECDSGSEWQVGSVVWFSGSMLMAPMIDENGDYYIFVWNYKNGERYSYEKLGVDESPEEILAQMDCLTDEWYEWYEDCPESSKADEVKNYIKSCVSNEDRSQDFQSSDSGIKDISWSKGDAEAELCPKCGGTMDLKSCTRRHTKYKCPICRTVIIY